MAVYFEIFCENSEKTRKPTKIGTGSMNRVKKNLTKVRMMKMKYMLVCLLGRNREAYLRKHQVFAQMGQNVLFQPMKLPNEPRLIKIHNNVKIASGVTFYTHDVINWMLADLDRTYYYGYRGCIEIHDNVFIGGNCQIVGGVSIGPNAVVGAGSVVTKDVPAGTVVAGNPARVIGSFEDLHEKRKNKYADPRINVLDLPPETLWQEYYESHSPRE